MKTKILSVVLALSLLLSVFAVIGITASAEGTQTVTIYDMSEGSRPTAYGLTSRDGYVTFASVDGQNVMRVARTGAKGTAQDQVAYFALPSDVYSAHGTPVSISFKMKTDTGKWIFNNRIRFNSSATNNQTLGIAGTGLYSASTTETTYTVDLTNTSYSGIVTNNYTYINIGNAWSSSGNTCTYLYIYDVSLTCSTTASAPTASFAKEDGTADAATSISATDVTFPAYTTEKAGFQFVGWSDGTNLYAAGDTATIEADTAYTAVSIKITTADTAAVRWSNTTDKAGLKFNTQIAADGFTTLIDLRAVSAASVGAQISKTNDFTTNTMTVSNDTSSKGESAGWLNTIYTDYFEFNSTAANYDKALGATSLIDTTLYARGYVTVTYADGGTATFYAATNAGASMKNVASAAYASADAAHKAVLTKLYDVTGE